MQRKNKPFVSRIALAVTKSSPPTGDWQYFYEPTSGQRRKTLGTKYFLQKAQCCPQRWCSLHQPCWAVDGSGLVHLRSGFWRKSCCCPHSPKSASMAAWSQQCKLDCSAQKHFRTAADGLWLLVGMFSLHSQAADSPKPPKSLWQRHKDGHRWFHSTLCLFARHYLSFQRSHCHHCTPVVRQRLWSCRAILPVLSFAPCTGLLCTAAIPSRLVEEGMLGDSPLLITSRGPVSNLVKTLLSHFHAEWVMAVFKTSLLPFSNPELNLAFLMLLF